MDGERRGMDASWPAARPGRQAPHHPASGAHPGAAQAYAGPPAGAPADPAATQAYAAPPAGAPADPAATQAYVGPSAGFPGRGTVAGTTTAGTAAEAGRTARPSAPTQAFGTSIDARGEGPGAAGRGGGGMAPAGGDFDTVAFQGPAGGYAGSPSAGRPQGFDQPGFGGQQGFTGPGGYGQHGFTGQQGDYGPGDYGPGAYGQQGPPGPGGYGQQGSYGPGGPPPGPGGPMEVYPGGPSGPGHPGGRNGSGPAGPSRSVVLASLGAAALLAVVAGTVYAVSGGSSDSTSAATLPPQAIDTVAPSTPSAAPSTAVSSPTTTPSATPSVAASPSASAATTPAYGTAPTGYVSDPGAQEMDFGTVLSVKKQGSKAVIRVKRQQFLTGDAAQQYYAQHPNKEPMDYAIVDVWEKHQFTVTSDCLIYGQYLLGDRNSVSTVQLTVSQFVTRTKALLSKSIPLHVWLHHEKGHNGPVTYLAEQYTP